MGDSTEWNGFPEPRAPIRLSPSLPHEGRGWAARRYPGGRRPPPLPPGLSLRL